MPHSDALRFEGKRTTWRELQRRVETLAGALARRGVGFGDRVAILMGNRPEFIESILAITRLGAIAVPLNFRLTGPETTYALENSGAVALLVDTFGKSAAREAIRDRSGPFSSVYVGSEALPYAEAYEDLLSEENTQHALVDVPETSPALIMYTSGTTGQPKGAVLTHANLQMQALAVIRAWGLCTDREVNLVAAPMFHAGALGSIIPMILTGGTQVIMPSGGFTSSHALELMATEGVTTAFLVPTHWQALCDDPSVVDRDLSTLRVTSWGAAPATPTLLRRMAELFPRTATVALFGQTEMSPITCVLEGKDAIRKLGSVGKPIPTVAVRVVDADMNDVVPGEVGEIVYRGPNLMAGYWQNTEQTEEAFRGGWFHSGDLVRVDAEGFIFVVDRAKDMIISGGENIYCAEVENLLSAHPSIVDISVVGKSHPKWGETPVAVATLTAGSTLAIEELRAWAGASIARFKLPTELVVTAVLPRNASGKVDKGRIRKMLDGTDTSWTEETTYANS
ncbi:long-chain-fatty-acid--CoA ligase (plasmid) [Rhodococcus qingshengii]|nr:long-chain-fatty-acid--CoA ligase [Rhodococcus qingshengii]